MSILLEKCTACGLTGQPVLGRASETTHPIHWEFLDVTIAATNRNDCFYK